MGLYTGIPNIDIPFFTVRGSLINVPISISYHAGGIKVEEVSSSIGIGWSLNAGGVITRSIRGLPDETLYGYLAMIQYYPLPYQGNLSDPNEYEKNGVGSQKRKGSAA